jgi:hypothetical protein
MGITKKDIIAIITLSALVIIPIHFSFSYKTPNQIAAKFQNKITELRVTLPDMIESDEVEVLSYAKSNVATYNSTKIIVSNFLDILSQDDKDKIISENDNITFNDADLLLSLYKSKYM